MTKKEYFIYTAIIIAIAVGIFYISTPSSHNMDLYDKKMDSLQTVINNNNIRIKQQEQKDSIFNIHITKIDSQNTVYGTKINKLIKYANQKIKAVDNMSNDSIFKSLTNRYNH
jgi:hypothetical protein